MDHLAEALKKRKMKGIDLTIIVGNPKDSEDDKKDMDLAPKPTAEDIQEIEHEGSPEHEGKEQSLMDMMSQMHGKPTGPENPFEAMMRDKESAMSPDSVDQKGMQEHLTSMPDHEKETLMGRKAKSIGERVRQMAMMKKDKKSE